MLAAALAVGATSAMATSALAQEPAPPPDTTGPSAFDMKIYGVDQADPGYVHQGGQIYMYADVRDPAGVKSVTADISSVGMASGTSLYSNATIPMDGDPTVSSWWYHDWRARTTVAEGTYPWSVTMTDQLGNTSTQSSTVIVDNTPAKATDVQTANGAGGTVGKPEQGDSITYSLSEMVNRFVASDGGDDVVVRIDNSGTNDILRVYNAQNSYLSPAWGSVALGKDYVSANRTFGATGTKSRMVRNGNNVTITLGTPSGTTNKVTSAAKMTWTPGNFACDRAGNKSLTTPATETGTLDVEF
jgi:hypothetical protein